LNKCVVKINNCRLVVHYEVINAHIQMNRVIFPCLIKTGTLVSMELAGMLIPHCLGNSLWWSEIRSGFDRNHTRLLKHSKNHQTVIELVQSSENRRQQTPMQANTDNTLNRRNQKTIGCWCLLPFWSTSHETTKMCLFIHKNSCSQI